MVFNFERGSTTRGSRHSGRMLFPPRWHNNALYTPLIGHLGIRKTYMPAPLLKIPAFDEPFNRVFIDWVGPFFLPRPKLGMRFY